MNPNRRPFTIPRDRHPMATEVTITETVQSPSMDYATVLKTLLERAVLSGLMCLHRTETNPNFLENGSKP